MQPCCDKTAEDPWRPSSRVSWRTSRSAARGIARDHASLIVHGADRPGIVAAVAAVLSGHGANIVSLDQYSDNPEGGAFFQRTVFSVPDLTLRLPEIEESLSERVGKGLRP